MATNTYVALDKVTVSGTSTTSVTISGISGLYTDLRLVINSQNQNSTNQPYIQFNADTSSGSTNYSTTSLRGDGSSAASSRHTNQNGWYPVPGPGVGTTGNFQPWLVDIMNYSNSTTFKTGLSRFNNSASIVAANAHLWRSTAAITSITITAESGAGYIVPGSTFTLYGIAAASVGAKATGGAIYSDSQYWYHAFGASGTFTPTQSLTADVLVVAGGGAGGDYFGGGGGAGGAQVFTSQSLTATNYTCTVGAGAAKYTYPTAGTNGGNSQFGSLTASVGGGYGASGGGRDGASGIGNGGSGGGGASGTLTTGGTGTSGQGYAGGNSAGATGNYGSAGGGGAGAAGGYGSTDGGAGGVGITSSFINAIGAATGVGQYVSGNWYIAGGGGGAVGGTGTVGAGGYGGGGIGCKGNALGQITALSAPGSANTGGGGGGGWTGASGGLFGDNKGGSGIIVVRYAK